MADAITIYPARQIITMNRAFPFAEAVAVRASRILGVGSIHDLTTWGDHTIDDRFRDHVLTPGFVEAHTHVMTGGVWQYTYVGYFDRKGPDGKLWKGCQDIDSVVDRLAGVEATLDDPHQPLVAWGLDPIYFPGERMVATHLDRVSDRRPSFVYHASGHLATVNSALMELESITVDTPTPGVARGADGQPNGELQEPAAMMLGGNAYREISIAMGTEEAIWNYGNEARNCGTTLVTDLGTTPVDNQDRIDQWRRVTDDPSFPTRVMVATMGAGFGSRSTLSDLAQRTLELQATGTEKLRFGLVKIVLDGSIQGFTARVTWPHYYNPPEGHPGNGLWLVPPDQMPEIVGAFHDAGLTVHCHCNGDEAAEVFIDAVEQSLERHPRWDHRHTVQHCQLTTPAQYRRMAALGMCANIFANHIFYWGDQHRDFTVGPERAARMDACATALREGVSFSIHSDAPITPMGHLHTAWSAINRLTASGDVLGPNERIPALAALESITIGGAHQLKLDHDLGSIEAGKLADFAVLDDDPLDVDPRTIKDIGVWGTVLGGVPFEAASGG